MLSSAPPFDRPDDAAATAPAASGGAPSPWSLWMASLRRAVSGGTGTGTTGGGVAQAGGLLNTVPTTSMGAADGDTSQRLAWRSTQRDHSAAAVEARRLEEAQADQAEAEAIARARALAQQQEQHTRRLAHRQSHSRSSNTDGPRFHVEEHSDEEEAERRAAKQPAHAASHAAAAGPESAAAAQGRDENPRAWLERIKDPGQ